MSVKPKVLVVLTSQDNIPTRVNFKTGWYLPEFVHPYNALAPHVDIVVASPKGGNAPLDPYSVQESQNDEACQRFLEDKQHLWKETEKLETFIGRSSEFAAIFYVGGHGREFSLDMTFDTNEDGHQADADNLAMFDLAVDEVSHALIREFYESGKIVSAVCHGPGALVNVKLSDGEYLVKGQEVTGFSNAEEDAYQFTDAMPFLLETEMKSRGGKYVKADQLFGVKVAVSGKDGRLITGQNPPSAGVIGNTLVEAIKKL
ncbi:Glutathione-independent glyoxalase [Colletotrichum chlorophyti]|uniref:D-lactate dehydratase n=1 Tax=Colletotrichum chlorophyti TaxID=708187 RepID=A0A1Q8RUN0_9PEZI|nr:Glutathione-independent glyoxalase [Colletotrichum chlorophyti]